MTVAAKCNITGLVLNRLNRLQWGIACKDTSCEIIEDYIQHLNCSDTHIIPCDTDNCLDAEPVIFNCNFNITSISATLNPIGEDADIIFDLKVINYVGGLLPFTYLWIYDTTDFDLIGNVTDPQIKLKLKGNKKIELLVTEIEVQITGADGCKDSKSCWLTPEGMECNVNYIPCPNTANLTASSIYTPCPKSKSLTAEPV